MKATLVGTAAQPADTRCAYARAVNEHLSFEQIFIDIVKSIASAGVGIIALLLSWVPIVNIFAFALAFLLVAFQYISYPQTRRGIGLIDGAGFLRRHFFASVGFGTTVTILYMIPFLSSFMLPLAVVGGTLLVARAGGSPALK